MKGRRAMSGWRPNVFRPRWYKVIRDLWGSKTRTILVVLSIAVGIFAVGMIISSQEILMHNLDKSYHSINPASALLYTAPFDNDVVRSVQRMKEIRDAEGRRTLAVRFKVGEGEWQNVDLIAIQDFNSIRINKIEHESGAWPPRKDEVLFERSTLDLIKLAVGDAINVETSNGEQRKLRMAGTVHDIQQIPVKFSGRAVGYINFDTLERLGEERKFNQLTIIVSKDDLNKTHIGRVANKVRDDMLGAIGINVFKTTIPDPGKHVMDSPLRAMTTVLGALGILSLILSAFLVVNTISALLAQQIRQIGMMKAVGAASSQVMGIYFTTVTVFGVLALLVAIPLSMLGAHAFSTFTASLLNFDITDFATPLWVFALEIAIGLMVPILASLYPIISGARLTVREAISSYGIGSKPPKRGLVDRFIGLMGGISRPLLLSIRNTFRRKGRLTMTLITLTLAAGIFVAVFSVRSSLLFTLDTLMQYWKYDIQISFFQPYRIKQIEHKALLLPGVERVESWGFKPVTRVRPDGTENENIIVLAAPALTDLIEPSMKEGRWLSPEDKNAIVVNTDLLKEEPDIALGNTLVFKINGRRTKWQVVGIVKGQLAGPMAYANYPYFTLVTRDAGRTNFVVIKTNQHDPESQSSIAKTLEERFKHVGIRVNSTETNANIRSRVAFQFNIIVVFMFIMVLLLAVVGGLGLMGTMSINVLERTREIGVMRAIGASNLAIIRIFISEGILIGIVSWVFGVVLAIPLSKGLCYAVGMAFMKMPLNYEFSLLGVAIWLAVVIAIATLASLLPAWKAAKLSVREILAYE
ncbi:MAG: ABC transporter permease [Candidatus Aquicultor sp.]